MSRSRDIALFSEAFLAEFGVDCGRNLEDTARSIGLKVTEVSGVSFDGALVKAIGLNRGRVAIRRDIRETPRKRFTLAHEIGHYVLPEHAKQGEVCQNPEIEAFRSGAPPHEQEANMFAAQILMPRQVVAPLAQSNPSFDTIVAVSRRCDSSLSASAVRYAELSPHRVAVVWSTDDHVRWYWRSEGFRRAVCVRRLTSDTLAARFFRGQDCPDRLEQVPAIAWLRDVNLREDATILEHTKYLPNYGSTLTLLVIPERIEQWREEDDEETDNEMNPAEFTLTRRRWPTKR